MQLCPVTNRRELKEFISLPAVIHCNHPRWVPPLYRDAWRYFDISKNCNAEGSDTIMFLVRKNGSAIGRIQGIISHRVNTIHNQKRARFANFECTNDPEVAQKLLKGVEDWAYKKGMSSIMGPKGFSNLDPEGFMVEGFQNEPTLSTYYNFKYVVDFLIALGYKKYVDYVAYKIPLEIPGFYEKIYNRIARQKEFELMEFSRRSALKQYVYPILELMNETYREHDGYIPLTEFEMQSLANRFIPLLDPHFIKAVLRAGQVIAFVIGMPNLNEGIRKSRGYLFPLGIFHIMRAARNSSQMDLLLGAIKKEYRGRGLDVLMGMAMYKAAITYGFKHIDSHLELETNTKVRAEMERAGGKIYKRYRIFIKQL
ncbi:MAG: hypothetical protein H8E14_14495 [Candidatus Marinimicrobia bacterium]|nr:hypothetical protein [Candidatus Neomarinimicrobiota bacterium]